MILPDFDFMAAAHSMLQPSDLFQLVPANSEIPPVGGDLGCFGWAFYRRDVGTIVLTMTSAQRVGVTVVDGSERPIVHRALVHAETKTPVRFRNFENASYDLGGLMISGGLPKCWLWDPLPLNRARWTPRRLVSGGIFHTFEWRGTTATWTVKEDPQGVQIYQDRKRVTRLTSPKEAFDFCEQRDREA